MSTYITTEAGTRYEFEIDERAMLALAIVFGMAGRIYAPAEVWGLAYQIAMNDHTGTEQ